MKKIGYLALVFILLLTLIGCVNPNTTPKVEKKKYTASFLTLFDTVTYIVGYSETKEEFEAHRKRYDEIKNKNKLIDYRNA